MTTERLGVTVLSTERCLELLSTQTVGRLAVSAQDLPEIFPVNFVVDHACIVFRTAAGTKLAACVFGRGVAFEVDGVDADTGEAWSVIVKGHAAEVERMQDLFDALHLPLYPWHAAPKHHFVRIDPVEISGRSFAIVDPSVWVDPVRTYL